MTAQSYISSERKISNYKLNKFTNKKYIYNLITNFYDWAGWGELEEIWIENLYYEVDLLNSHTTRPISGQSNQGVKTAGFSLHQPKMFLYITNLCVCVLFCPHPKPELASRKQPKTQFKLIKKTKFYMNLKKKRCKICFSLCYPSVPMSLLKKSQPIWPSH